MKTRLKSNEEVAHYWANKVQDKGETANLYFDGDEIYSYGAHFLAAKHYPKYNDAVLINSDSYSPSTGQHLSLILRSSSHLKCFRVPYPQNPKHKDNLKYLVSLVEDWILKAARGREANRIVYISEAKEFYERAQDYITTFRLRNKLKTYDFSELALDNVKKDLAEKAKIQRAKNKKLKEQALKDLSAKINLWKLGQTNIVPRSQHIKTALLRLNGDSVETSQGANVPLREARILCLKLKRGENVESFKIGHYTVNHISNGVLKIGCHSIEQSEIDYISKKILK
jgi:hypothetical protein